MICLYDITQDVKWIVGDIVLSLNPSEIQDFAKKICNLQIKPQWSKKKTLSRVLLSTFDLDKKTLNSFRIEPVEEEDLEKTPDNLLKKHSADTIAYFLWISGKHELYNSFVKKHKKRILKEIEKKKILISPYLEDSLLSREVLRLRSREEKLLNKEHLNQIQTSSLQQKIEEMSSTIKSLKNSLAKSQEKKVEVKVIEKVKTVTKTNTTNEGMVIRLPCGNGYIISFQKKLIQTPYSFLQDNMLLHGDIVKIKSSKPLKVSLVEPAKNRSFVVGTIQIEKDQYVIPNKQKNICIGFTDKFLPEGTQAEIAYVPDSIYGVIKNIFPFPKEKKRLKKRMSQKPVIYVAGGVKKSIYRDIVGEKYLLWSNGGETNRSIIRANIQKADAVFIICTYISHIFYNLLVENCKSLNTPFYFINSTGHSEFKNFYYKILKDNTELLSRKE